MCPIKFSDDVGLHVCWGCACAIPAPSLYNQSFYSHCQEDVILIGELLRTTAAVATTTVILSRKS